MRPSQHASPTHDALELLTASSISLPSHRKRAVAECSHVDPALAAAARGHSDHVAQLRLSNVLLQLRSNAPQIVNRDPGAFGEQSKRLPGLLLAFAVAVVGAQFQRSDCEELLVRGVAGLVDDRVEDLCQLRRARR